MEDTGSLGRFIALRRRYMRLTQQEVTVSKILMFRPKGYKEVMRFRALKQTLLSIFYEICAEDDFKGPRVDMLKDVAATMTKPAACQSAHVTEHYHRK